MEILGSIWYHCKTDSIGVVKVKNEENEIVYFIGTGNGSDLKQDEQRIKEWGSAFNPIAGEILIPN